MFLVRRLAQMAGSTPFSRQSMYCSIAASMHLIGIGGGGNPAGVAVAFLLDFFVAVFLEAFLAGICFDSY
jgi:hypothetical protein